MQELKGNIRVFARVRPPAAGEAAEAAPGAPVLGFPSAGELAGRGLELRQPAAGSKGGDAQAHSFAFDKVFAPQASQVGGVCTGCGQACTAGRQAALSAARLGQLCNAPRLAVRTCTGTSIWPADARSAQKPPRVPTPAGRGL